MKQASSDQYKEEKDFFSLTNFRHIKTPFAYIDESGALSRKDDPFFAIGLFKLHRPSLLYRELRRIQSKYNLYQEIKFNKLSYITLKIAKDFLRTAFSMKSGSFSAIVIPKTHSDFDIDRYFDGDIFQLYKKFLVEIIKKKIGEFEILTVIADDYFTPSDSKFEQREEDTFEGGVRAIVNDHFKRLALTGICQVNSKSNICLQLVDLLVGCCMFDIRIQSNLIQIQTLSESQKIKYELLNFVKNELKVDSTIFLEELPRHHEARKKFDTRLFRPRKNYGSSSIEATPADS